MKVIVTVSDMQRVAVVLDLQTGRETPIFARSEFKDPLIKGRPSCRPFGITWSRDLLYIANNRQLLVFDKQFQYQRTHPLPLQPNIHQIAYRDGWIWAVSPWTNSLIGVAEDSARAIEFDLLEYATRPYLERVGDEADDRHHFNSLLWHKDRLFVSAHAFGVGSFILEFDPARLLLVGAFADVGSEIHGLAHDGNELLWVSTGTAEVRSESGRCWKLREDGYARGFAVTDRFLVVGVSSRAHRNRRSCGDGWIELISRHDGQLIDKWRLVGSGSLNDLRILDEYDYAHQVDFCRIP